MLNTNHQVNMLKINTIFWKTFILEPIWRKVFSHDTSGGLFANLDEVKQKNVDNEDAALFSILYDLQSMKNDAGVFHFKLCHPDLTDYEFPCNEWTQTSNPVTETTITGYSPVKITWNKNSIQKPFHGLGLSPASFDQCLIDDAPGHYFWWNSIGNLKFFGRDTIPGPVTTEGKEIVVKRKNLYVKYKPSGKHVKNKYYILENIHFITNMTILISIETKPIK